MSEHHTILGGKVHVYKRPNSSSRQCASYLAGRNRRTTTKEDSLEKATHFRVSRISQLPLPSIGQTYQFILDSSELFLAFVANRPLRLLSYLPDGSD